MGSLYAGTGFFQGASISLNKSQNSQDNQINIPVKEAVGHVLPLLDHPAAGVLLKQYAPESIGAFPIVLLLSSPPSYSLNSIFLVRMAGKRSLKISSR